MNYSRHFQTETLDPFNHPENATHIATFPRGTKYFVKNENDKWWIQPSNQYGSGYAYSSLYMKDVVLTTIQDEQNNTKIKYQTRKQIEKIAQEINAETKAFLDYCQNAVSQDNVTIQQLKQNANNLKQSLLMLIEQRILNDHCSG